MQPPNQVSYLGTPPPEIEIDIYLVASLLQAQYPDFAHLSIHPVDMGWDNAIFRLGDKLAIRLPRRQLAAQLIENEQNWLPQIAPRLPIPVPTPVFIGQPQGDYPWKWSILDWLNGVAADEHPPDSNEAKNFAVFLRNLHITAPENAPKNLFRGIPLSQREGMLSERMQRLVTKTNLITPEIRQIWDLALQAEIDTASTWLHGDLHPRNVLVENGKITGIIDWGDMTSGDIATDLAAIWMLFPERQTRERVISEYGNISTATLQRAKGWALIFGIILVDTGLIDCPRHARMGEKALAQLLEDRD